jgi:3-dehydroquinate dehydratase / shikimate dehydrogenase
METQAAAIGTSQVGYEWRLDYLQDCTGLDQNLHQMFFRLRFPYSIATCRRTEAGGQFSGSVEEQVRILESAVRAGCHWVDIEVESLDQGGKLLLRRFKPARVVVSYHDYRTMPRLGEVYRRLSRLPVHAVKIAGYVRRLTDNLNIESFLKSHRGSRLIVVGLGPSGLPSRLLGLKWGSLLTYASTGSHPAAASGQLPAHLMRAVYRVEHLDRHTQHFGIVGSRASVSLSPAMQNAAFTAKHVNAIYVPCETKRLSDFLELARHLNFCGFSVTMPYKRAIMRELDWIDPLAAEIGACNTVAVQHGKWMGWNTDAAAVVEVLTKRLRLGGSRILILGAGGAARSAAFALRGEGAEVFIAARREVRAQQLARAISAQALPWTSADGLDVDAVINATPIGMAPNSETIPIDLARLRVRVVFDMVYHPMETRFLAEARGRGLTTISGLEMLVGQGARQFEIWTGESAPRALMEQAVRQGFYDTDLD